jgi:anaerobic ribonucleoside-triphosphate reductase activating protein
MLNVHALLEASEVNGPGRRGVIWLQGCPRRCPGCCNPDAQPIEPRQLLTALQLFAWAQALPGIEGLTITGGEPLLQALPLAAFLRLLRTHTDLSVVLYTGYLLEEVRALPGGQDVLSLIDVLVDGPYDCSQPATDGLRGSLNQRIHLLTSRYTPADFHLGLRFEVIIAPDGTIIRTGVTAASKYGPQGP